ncbi:homogentisate 1,2-dioxygenase [Desertimonas flava]|uniref:homogentisate 1,2-dioxygenase n=1 Tax=Desertimonas flava TaxID=2064846 RepID=UPI000E352967|nr:cupin domain-containing protein [Desertimonas flava]
MTYYRTVGAIPRKRHTLHRVDGQVCVEELVGEEGFSGPSSLLYHRHSPSAIVAIESVDIDEPVFGPNLPVTPHHLRTGDVPAGDDAVTARTALLGNEDVEIGVATATRTSPLYRDAVGDQLVYVQSGSAVLESVFGRLPVRDGDYVVIPTGITHRWVIEGDSGVELLVVRSRSHIGVPRKYLTPTGQLAEGAPFSERDLRGPEPEPLLVEGADVDVLVRARAGWSRHVHRDHPFDVVGWDGCVYPWALSIHDFEPIVGRIHQPPPVHQTFAGDGFVVCSFVPRLFDFDPHAVKVPYHHANVDSDEVLYYSAGDFMSRSGSGIGVGSISLHPAGFTHGPQPGSRERSEEQAETAEVAVMVDTFRPLGLSDAARAISDPDYPWSWAGGR